MAQSKESLCSMITVLKTVSLVFTVLDHFIVPIASLHSQESEPGPPPLPTLCLTPTAPPGGGGSTEGKGLKSGLAAPPH